MNLPQNGINLIIGLGILVGAIQCFFGYRIFKIILGITGFLGCGAIAANIGYAFWGNEIAALLAGLFGGIIGAALLVWLYFLGIFVIGAYLGGIFGTALFALLKTSPEPIILIILAAIAGVVALIFQKIMIIAATGFGGAWSVVTGVVYFTTGKIDPANLERLFKFEGSLHYAIIFCWLALGITGSFLQYRSSSPERPEAKPRAAPDRRS